MEIGGREVDVDDEGDEKFEIDHVVFPIFQYYIQKEPRSIKRMMNVE